MSWVVGTQNVVCLKEEAYSWVVVEVVGMQEELTALQPQLVVAKKDAEELMEEAPSLTEQLRCDALPGA